MVRAVFVADTHLGFDHPIRASSRRRRGEDFFANYAAVHRAARSADLMIHGGDLFTMPSPHQSVLMRAYGELWRTAEAGTPIVITPGNHERSRFPSSLVFSHPDVHVLAEPGTTSLCIRGTRLSISGFPFDRDARSTYPDLLRATRWWERAAEYRFVLAHQAFEGASVGPSDFTFRDGRDVVRRESTPRDFDAVLSGHIHRRQSLGGSHVPVHYPGSTERTSFAERDEVKGYLELTLERGVTVDFVPLPARDMHAVLLDGVPARDVPTHLAAAAASMAGDAVVNIRARNPVAASVRRVLTASLVARTFGPESSVSLSASLFREPSRARGRS